jgi:hypothetical protein
LCRNHTFSSQGEGLGLGRPSGGPPSQSETIALLRAQVEERDRTIVELQAELARLKMARDPEPVAAPAAGNRQE